MTSILANVKTVSTPCQEYEEKAGLWKKCRAVCNGEHAVKEYDSLLDVVNYSNLLIPFSPSMTQAQYNFYRAEAELPEISTQFAKMLVGALLRKKPTVVLPEGAPADAADWLNNSFGQDDSSLTTFMDTALWEEMQNSRCWVHVDYPEVSNAEDLTPEETMSLRPFPVIWKGESVINWIIETGKNGRDVLKRLVVKGEEEVFTDGEFHPKYLNTFFVHELNEAGTYQVRVFQQKDAVDAKTKQIVTTYELARTNSNILVNGEPLMYIPAWPLNGEISPQVPMLMPIVDKEVALYNKVSRRNHLLYGAATYTPWIASDMADEDFQEVVGAGLGSWLRLRTDDKIGVLETPTAALGDMEKAIASGIEEMARLGIRMLSPESAQSGVALQLRNASQTAQLGSLNSRISAVMNQIVVFMLNWKYDLDYSMADVTFTLSSDLNPAALGPDFLRLATEWYEGGHIPRSVWLDLLKQNDMLDTEYDDEVGKEEILKDKEEGMIGEDEAAGFARGIAEKE